jgi:mediator of RNA polymerase II transcription subunit 5
MAMVYRYDLTYYDIGIGHDTFIAKLLKRGHHSTLPDEMTEEQGKHLGNWLKGLYDADKEGLSNDVFASCRPQDFYLIVPTLFRQTVMACSVGVLSFESVKGGLECKRCSNTTASNVAMLTDFQILERPSLCRP